MEVAKYRISATGPENAVLGPIEITGITSYEASVIPGTWTVNVAALNSSGLEIGSGSNSVAVHAGSITPCSVKIAEKTGKGQVNFNIEDTTWQIASMTAQYPMNAIRNSAASHSQPQPMATMDVESHGLQ